MSSFCTAKATHIFSAKKFQNILVSLDVNFNKSLTNDVVSFEQLGPDLDTDNQHEIIIPYHNCVMGYNKKKTRAPIQNYSSTSHLLAWEETLCRHIQRYKKVMKSQNFKHHFLDRVQTENKIQHMILHTTIWPKAGLICSPADSVDISSYCSRKVKVDDIGDILKVYPS